MTIRNQQGQDIHQGSGFLSPVSNDQLDEDFGLPLLLG
jgi:hypothetical protein